MPTLNRRHFLRLSGLAASSLAFHSARTAENPPPRRLRLGFLGLQHSHARGKLAALQQSPDFEIVGASEPNPDVRARFANAGLPFLPQLQLLSQIEVAVVESSVAHHAADALTALKAGLHVHVEKPPAVHLRDLRRLLATADQNHRLLQVGYMWRFNPGITRALEAAQRGWLGNIFMVRATMNTRIADAERREWARFPGGALFEQGCHLVDPIVRLLGRPSKVHSFLKRSIPRRDSLQDNTLAVLEYPHCLATISNAAILPNAGEHRLLEILGTNGTARVQPLEPPQLLLDLDEARGPYSRGRQNISLPAYQRYLDEFSQLAAAIRNRQPLPVHAATELLIQETLLRACRI